MIQSILVPTDFSGNALKAALFAADMAARNGAAVHLLHVIEPVTNHIRQPSVLHQKLQEEIRLNRESELAAVQQSVTGKYPDVKTTTGLTTGSVIGSVIDTAQKTGADLIVSGTKGATGLKEVFMGSVTAGIISNTTLPVLAIPGEYEMEEPDQVLFVTNRFEENPALLNGIVEVAALFSAGIQVAVFVTEENADDYREKSSRLNQYMEWIRKKYPGIVFRGEIIRGKDFEQVVEEYDEKKGIDMIAMITYPKNFIDKLLKKSRTRKMALHSKIPVLALPAK